MTGATGYLGGRLSSLGLAFSGVDIAFYLVHPMFDGNVFEVADSEAAANFALAARDTGVRRIIYLGGLAQGDDLSAQDPQHLTL